VDLLQEVRSTTTAGWRKAARCSRAEKNEKVLVWPDLVYTELICMVVLTAVLIAWGILFLQAPLEEPASGG
jgi:hypothetical protein